jgi:hypothetical protein
VPVTVNVAVPVVAFAAAVIVSVELFPVALVGLTVAVTPVGAPVTMSATAAVRLVRVMFTVLVPLAPCANDCVGVARASVNEDAGAAVTTSVKVAVTGETPNPVAFTVMGYVPASVAAATLMVTVAVVVPPEF